MLVDTTKLIMKYTIFLGLIGLFVAWAFNLNGTFVQKDIINGVEIYRFNWYKYANTLNNVWTTNALDFNTILPTREFKELGFFDWEGLFNNIAVVFDWLYFPLNFILYILRWVVWVLRLTLAVIGWDFSYTVNQSGVIEYQSILVTIFTWITQNLMIPYV